MDESVSRRSAQAARSQPLKPCRRASWILPALALLAVAACALAQLPSPRIHFKAPPALRTPEPGEARLLAGLLRERYDANRRYALRSTPDALTYQFRLAAGLAVPDAALDRACGEWGRQSGFEPGEWTGHWLAAASLIAAYDGDRELRDRVAAVMRTLRACQLKHGDGYVLGMPSADFVTHHTRHEPYYIWCKDFTGWLYAYRYLANRDALDVMCGMEDWARRTTASLPDAELRTTRNWYYMLTEWMLGLYALHGDPADLRMAQRFALADFLDRLAAGIDALGDPAAFVSPRHSYAHTEALCGFVEMYETTGEQDYLDAALAGWRLIHDTRQYETGGQSHEERWGDPLTFPLSTNSPQENCAGMTLIRLSHKLLQLTGDARYADEMERILYNDLLAHQQPDTGVFCYYLPLNSGSAKPYDGVPFSCCSGSGLRGVAMIPQWLYSRTADALYVNLYAGSRYEGVLNGTRVRLDQKTRYPRGDDVLLQVHCVRPARFALCLRIPGWAKPGDVSLTLNGSPRSAARPGSYASIRRLWRDGDTVRLTLRMRLAVRLPAGVPHHGVVRYGPLVLAAESNAGATRLPSGAIAAFTSPQTWLKPAQPGSLSWQVASDHGAQIRFRPFYEFSSAAYRTYLNLSPAWKDPDDSGNLARSATVAASATFPGYDPRGAIDGVVGGFPGDPRNEWASKGEQQGAWLELRWKTPVEIDTVALWDRPNLLDQVLEGRLTFGDGGAVSVGALADDAVEPTVVRFPRRRVTWLRFTVVRVKPGSPNIGLSEIAVFGPR